MNDNPNTPPTRASLEAALPAIRARLTAYQTKAYYERELIMSAPSDIQILLTLVEELQSDNARLRERFEHVYYSLSNDLVHVESFPEQTDGWYKEYENAIHAYMRLCCKVLGWATPGGDADAER